ALEPLFSSELPAGSRPSPAPAWLRDRKIGSSWDLALTFFSATSARRLQPLHFFQRQRAVLPGQNVERQRSIAVALDLFHVMPHSLKHAPNLAIAAFD